MRVWAVLAAVLSLPTLFSDVVVANSHDSAGHVAVVNHRRLAEVAGTNHTLGKRDFGDARFTYYYVEVGEVACGGWYKDGDLVRRSPICRV